MNNLHMSEILSSKYDVHLDYQITMYDQLPYKRNADLCGEKNIAMYSGHIIKYYMCDNNKDQFKINNHDDEIKNILAEIEAHTVVTPTVEDAASVSTNDPDGISQEQIQTLLNDNGDADIDSSQTDDFSMNEFSNDDIDDNEPNPSIPTVDAFAGIEDW